MADKKEDVLKLAKSILEEVKKDPKAAAAISKLAKSNPDAKADEELGEKVEHDVIDHLKDNKAAEAKEGDLKGLVMEKWEPRFYKKELAKNGEKNNSSRGSDIGVHKPMFDQGGKSLAGHAARKGHQWAPQEHRRVLKDLKGMPAPKLPKSEPMGKAHIGFNKLKGQLAHEKGVHNPGAVAAAIGREKFGAKGMEAKAKAGMNKSSEDLTSPNPVSGSLAGGSSMSTGLRMSEDVKKCVMEKWEPRFHKMDKAEKGKNSPPPVMADRLVKPKDVKESGVSDMAIMKLKSPKGNN